MGKLNYRQCMIGRLSIRVYLALLFYLFISSVAFSKGYTSELYQIASFVDSTYMAIESVDNQCVESEEIETYIPYEVVGNTMRVKGFVNGFAAVFTYVPSAGNTICAHQAEYYLANGYIDDSAISGFPVIEGKISIGSRVKVTLKLAEEIFEDIEMEVVSNDHHPLVFGYRMFPKEMSVTRDKAKRLLVIKKNINNK